MRARSRSLATAGLTVLTLLGASPGAAALADPGTIENFAGDHRAAFAGDGGPAAAASLNKPRDSVVGPDGSIYVADTFNHRIRRISPDGIITTVAGTGSTTYNGDGILATRASLYWPHDVAVDEAGVLYIADSNHHRIRRVGTDGIITTIAGTGRAGSTGDGGAATSARLKNPKSVVLRGGYLYVAALDHRVRRVQLFGGGLIQPFAGTGVQGYAGDNGPALTARLNIPQRLQIDSQGNLFVADTGNHVVRRIDGVSGIITTVAGTGVRGFRGDGGPAVRARLNQPRGIALAGDRRLLVADSNNHRVRMVDLATGVITTVAGTVRGYAGDGGPATAARLYQPRGLSVTPDGDVLVADTLNSVVRIVHGP